MVNKNKISDFIDMYHEDDTLKDCSILRILPSGNYHIYTFQIDKPEQKDYIKSIEDDWV